MWGTGNLLQAWWSTEPRFLGFPRGPVSKNPPASAAGMVPLLSRKTPYAAGRLSPRATTAEPVVWVLREATTEPTHPRACFSQQETTTARSPHTSHQRGAPPAAVRESLRAAVRTQHSLKKQVILLKTLWCFLLRKKFCRANYERQFKVEITLQRKWEIHSNFSFTVVHSKYKYVCMGVCAYIYLWKKIWMFNNRRMVNRFEDNLKTERSIDTKYYRYRGMFTILYERRGYWTVHIE